MSKTMAEAQYIRQVAESSVESFIDYARRNYGWDNIDFELFREPMENVAVTVAMVVSTKQKSELEKQIEKMKCCANCEFQYVRSIVAVIDDESDEPCCSCKEHSNWKLRS